MLFRSPIGTFIEKSEIPNINDIPFLLKKNGSIVQEGSTKDMIFSFDKIISYVSQFFTLKIGDLIFTGTPAGVGKVEIDDLLEGYLFDEKLITTRVK